MLDIITDISSEVEQWNQTNWKQREKILLPMRLIINSQCHRMGFLSYLGDDILPPGAERTVVTPENCCNRPGCNPTRNEALPLGPEPPKAITAPRINS